MNQEDEDRVIHATALVLGAIAGAGLVIGLEALRFWGIL